MKKISMLLAVLLGFGAVSVMAGQAESTAKEKLIVEKNEASHSAMTAKKAEVQKEVAVEEESLKSKEEKYSAMEKLPSEKVDQTQEVIENSEKK